MAHFAELDDNNVVLRVLVVANEELLDENGNESEIKGADFLRLLFGGNWVQTSYNGKFRKQLAAVGGTYDPVKNVFVLPCPYPSWVLDADCNWQAPVPMPADENMYLWDETAKNWVAVPKE